MQCFNPFCKSIPHQAITQGDTQPFFHHCLSLFYFTVTVEHVGRVVPQCPRHSSEYQRKYPKSPKSTRTERVVGSEQFDSDIEEYTSVSAGAASWNPYWTWSRTLVLSSKVKPQIDSTEACKSKKNSMGATKKASVNSASKSELGSATWFDKKRRSLI